MPAADGIDIVGRAINVTGGDRTTRELAINVTPAFGGVGLAHTPMTGLIDRATRRGLALTEGFVLAVNQPMPRLARRLGFGVEADLYDRAGDPPAADTRFRAFRTASSAGDRGFPRQRTLSAAAAPPESA